MKSFINITLVIILFLTASQGWCATYYVKSGGNDALDGLSDSTAWATISRVNKKVNRGDTVYFRSQDTWSSVSMPVLAAFPGVLYDGSTYGSGTRATLKATRGYTGKIIEAVVNIFTSDVTFRGFEIDGNEQITGGIYVGTHAKRNISNITIDNCVVHDNGGPESPSTKYYYGIHIGSIMPYPTTVSKVSVLNTTVYNTGHEGIAIYPTWLYANNKVDGVLIRNCTIHDAAHWGGNDWGDGISVTNDSDNVTVEYTTIYNAFRGLCVATSTVNTGSPNNLAVRYNIIHDNIVAGISFVCPSGITGNGSFYGNLIFNNGKPWQYNYSAEIIISGRHDYSTSVFNFYNNTIYSTTSTATGDKCAVSVSQMEPVVGTPVFNFRNNIIYSGNYPAIKDPFNILTHSNNLVYRASGASHEHINNGTSYTRAGVLKWEHSAKNTNPYFVGGTLPTGFTGTYGIDIVPNSDFFAITSGDALNNGATLGSPYDAGINGAGLATPFTRPQGAAYDIGAYEYVEPVRGTAPLPAPGSLKGKSK
jgi:hypothetical protein